MRHIIVFIVNNRSFYTPTSFKLVGAFYCKKLNISYKFAIIACRNKSEYDEIIDIINDKLIMLTSTDFSTQK